jgi:hypothetical protein
VDLLVGAGEVPGGDSLDLPVPQEYAEPAVADNAGSRFALLMPLAAGPDADSIGLLVELPSDLPVPPVGSKAALYRGPVDSDLRSETASVRLFKSNFGHVTVCLRTCMYCVGDQTVRGLWTATGRSVVSRFLVNKWTLYVCVVSYLASSRLFLAVASVWSHFKHVPSCSHLCSDHLVNRASLDLWLVQRYHA